MKERKEKAGARSQGELAKAIAGVEADGTLDDETHERHETTGT